MLSKNKTKMKKKEATIGTYAISGCSTQGEGAAKENTNSKKIGIYTRSQIRPQRPSTLVHLSLFHADKTRFIVDYFRTRTQPTTDWKAMTNASVYRRKKLKIYKFFRRPKLRVGHMKGTPHPPYMWQIVRTGPRISVSWISTNGRTCQGISPATT